MAAVIGALRASQAVRKGVKVVTALGNGAIDGALAGYAKKTGKTWPAWAMIIKNLALPALYIAVDDPTGILEGAGVSSTYFWGIVLTAPGDEESARRGAPRATTRVVGFKRAVRIPVPM